MSIFISEVRSGQIPQPTQKTFTLERWRQAFEEIERPSDADVRLYKTGIWAFNKFETIRRNLSPLWLSNIPKESLLLMFAGVTNRDCTLIANARLPVGDENFLVAEQAIQGTIASQHNIGPPAHPEHLLMASIDGIRFPLRQAFSHRVTPGSLPPEEKIIERIKATSILGQLYDLFEAYWMQALWNGWYIEPKDKDATDLMLPPSTIYPIISAVSEYRRDALSAEVAMYAVNLWERMPAELKGQPLSSLPKVHIKGSGKKRKYEVRKREFDDSISLRMLHNRYKADRGYYEPLMDLPLPKLGSITLRILLEAWEVVLALAESLMATMPTVEDSGVVTVDKLLRYSPSIYSDQVVALVQKWRGHSSTDASKIVEFFSYGPQSRAELWARPLVKLGNGRLIPLLIPLLYGNMERTFELWMKEGGLELTDKGFAFEVHAREELREALTESEIMKDAEVYPSSVTIRHGEEREEIDLVIRIKNVLLLGEAKCLLFPSEPIEFSRYFEVLKVAASQIRRKVQFASEHKEALLQSLNMSKRPEPKDLRLLPLILVNQPYGAGFTISGIPVIDLVILTRYFEGKWYRMVPSDPMKSPSPSSTFFLYRNEEEAALHVGKYLADPPQLRHYRENVKPDIQWYPQIDNQDRKFAASTLKVVLPLPKLDYKIEAGDEDVDL